MRKYLVTRLVAVLLFVAAIIALILGIVAAGALGLSGGWGPGSRAWLVVPIVIITIFNTGVLLVFGAILLFLTRIEMNLEIVQSKGKPARPRARVVAPPPAPKLDRDPFAPVESVAAAVATVDAPMASEEPLPSEGVAAELAADVASDGDSRKLPGADEAARIAREMAASRPGPLAPPANDAPVEPPAPPEEPVS
jgi:hypothetical protein